MHIIPLLHQLVHLPILCFRNEKIQWHTELSAGAEHNKINILNEKAKSSKVELLLLELNTKKTGVVSTIGMNMLTDV